MNTLMPTSRPTYMSVILIVPVVPVNQTPSAFFSHIAPKFSSTWLARIKTIFSNTPAFKYEHMIKFSWWDMTEVMNGTLGLWLKEKGYVPIPFPCSGVLPSAMQLRGSIHKIVSKNMEPRPLNTTESQPPCSPTHIIPALDKLSCYVPERNMSLPYLSHCYFGYYSNQSSILIKIDIFIRLIQSSRIAISKEYMH